MNRHTAAVILSVLSLVVSIAGLFVAIITGTSSHYDASLAISSAAQANDIATKANDLGERAINEAHVGNATAESALALAQRVDNEHLPIPTAACTQSVGPATESLPSQVLVLGVNANVVGSDQHPLLIRNPNVAWLRCIAQNAGNTTARDVRLVFHFIHIPQTAAFDRKLFTDSNSHTATAFFDALEPQAPAKVFYVANADRSYKAIVEPPREATFYTGAVSYPTTAPIRLEWGSAELKPLKS